MRNLAFACGMLVMTAAIAECAGVLVTPDELARRDGWVNARFETNARATAWAGLRVLANNDPRLKGKLPPALMPGGSSNQMNEMMNANEENQKQFIDGYLDHGIPISFWWRNGMRWFPTTTGTIIF